MPSSTDILGEGMFRAVRPPRLFVRPDRYLTVFLERLKQFW